MTALESIVCTVFGLAFLSALLCIPILGFAPLFGVLAGLGMFAALGSYVEKRRLRKQEQHANRRST